MYISMYSSRSIKRAHLDGSQLQTFLTVPEANSYPTSLWLDKGMQMLYWTQTNSVLKRASLAQQDYPPTVETLDTAASGSFMNRMLAVDTGVTPRMLYFPCEEGWVLHKAWSDSAVESNFYDDWNRLYAVSSFTVDPVSRHMYWGDSYHRTISRISLDFNTLSTDQTEVLLINVDRPSALVVDSSYDRMCWMSMNRTGQFLACGRFHGAPTLETLWTKAVSEHTDDPKGLQIMDSTITKSQVCSTTVTTTDHPRRLQWL